MSTSLAKRGASHPKLPCRSWNLSHGVTDPERAANVGVNIVGLGGKAILVGVIGRDDAGDTLLSKIQSEKVAIGGVFLDGADQPPRKLALSPAVSRSFELIARVRHWCHPASRTHSFSLFPNSCPKSSACILSDYAKGVISPRLARDDPTSMRRR